MEVNEPINFSITRSDTADRMVLELAPQFTHEHWEALSTSLRTKVEEGLLLWDLDLRRLQLPNSPLLGALIGMNTVLHNSHGDLRLIVTKDSTIASLLYMAKLNRILTILET